MATTCLETKLVSEKMQTANEKEAQFIERKQAIEKTTRLEYKFQAQMTEIKYEREVEKMKLKIAELNVVSKFESEKMRYLELDN